MNFLELIGKNSTTLKPVQKHFILTLFPLKPNSLLQTMWRPLIGGVATTLPATDEQREQLDNFFDTWPKKHGSAEGRTEITEEQLPITYDLVAGQAGPRLYN